MTAKSKTEWAFYDAVISGDAAGLTKLLDSHPELIRWQGKDDFGVPDETGLLLNTRFLARGDRDQAYEVFDILMQARPDVNARDRTGFTPLMMSCMNGETKMVEALLAAGADPHLTNNDGGTALMYAAQKGSIDCAAMLLSRGVPVDARDKDGQTALFKTRYAGDAAPAIIRYLIGQGASAFIFDNAGKCPAQVAFDQKYEDIAESYSKIAAQVAGGKRRDAAVLEKGISRPLTVGKPLRLKS
ncbi:MAG: ankyrin repeat domain-containing protein [Alphaproteobacteria bacterium]